MILDAVKRSLTDPHALIPVEQLLSDARGSRMPDVEAARLTPVIAQRVVEACRHRRSNLVQAGSVPHPTWTARYLISRYTKRPRQ